MALDPIQQHILEIVRERAPVGDEAIGRETTERLERSQVVALTAELQRAALIERSESAPDGWQLTDDGRRALTEASPR
jgi:DNA-binding MarR family transcriptional regulator